MEFAETTDVVLNETLPAVEEAVAQGKARYVGITGYSLDVLKEVILQAPGRIHVNTVLISFGFRRIQLEFLLRFQSVLTYARYTLLDDSLVEFLPFFEEQQIGVICASGLAMGLLTNTGPQSWHPATEETKESARNAAEYCKGKGIDLAKLAIHYWTALKGPATFLAGMQTRKLLDSNWRSYISGINDEEQKTLNYILEKYDFDRWTHRNQSKNILLSF